MSKPKKVARYGALWRFVRVYDNGTFEVKKGTYSLVNARAEIEHGTVHGFVGKKQKGWLVVSHPEAGVYRFLLDDKGQAEGMARRFADKFNNEVKRAELGSQN